MIKFFRKIRYDHIGQNKTIQLKTIELLSDLKIQI